MPTRKLTKLCHVVVGQKIQLAKAGVAQDEVFIVSATPRRDAPERVGTKRSSLSYEKSPAFLVSMVTGNSQKLPPLTSEVFLLEETVEPVTPVMVLPAKLELPGPVLSDARISACVQILENNRRDWLADTALAA